MKAALLTPRVLSGRLRQVRVERFGEDGTGLLAERLGLPALTWANIEAGCTIPGQTLVCFIELTRVDTHWLATGEGPRYLE